MKTQYIHLAITSLAISLAACTQPKKDIAGLKAEIDAAYPGHYGQAMRHEEQAAEQQKIAEHVLKHWEKDYYWNIDEKRKAENAAKLAAMHRHESEKEFCLWLTEVHGQNHHKLETHHHAAAFFKTDSAIPYKADDEAYLSNRQLSEIASGSDRKYNWRDRYRWQRLLQPILVRHRAETVKRLLLGHGAKNAKLSSKPLARDRARSYPESGIPHRHHRHDFPRQLHRLPQPEIGPRSASFPSRTMGRVLRPCPRTDVAIKPRNACKPSYEGCKRGRQNHSSEVSGVCVNPYFSKY